MSNKVFVEMEAPEAVWVRGDCAVAEDGTMKYEAKFCRAGVSPRPLHLGPIVSLVVMNGQGKEVARRSVTIGVKTNGDLFLQYYKEAESELEKSGLPAEPPPKKG